VFGLVGLYLPIEKQFSGSQVQRVHKELGRRKREWQRAHARDELGISEKKEPAQGVGSSLG
jgi:hypothetical protein